jgi:hypothetical protein
MRTSLLFERTSTTKSNLKHRCGEASTSGEEFKKRRHWPALLSGTSASSWTAAGARSFNCVESRRSIISQRESRLQSGLIEQIVQRPPTTEGTWSKFSAIRRSRIFISRVPIGLDIPLAPNLMAPDNRRGRLLA